MSPCPGSAVRLVEGQQKTTLPGGASQRLITSEKQESNIDHKVDQTSAVSALLALKKTLHDQLMAREMNGSDKMRTLSTCGEKSNTISSRDVEVTGVTRCNKEDGVTDSDVDEQNDDSLRDEDGKPNQSYISLISNAILSSPDKRLVLSDIYNYVSDNFPYFRDKGPGWRNSIRHNLSLNECFVKVGRSPNGKGHYWAINAANYDDFSKGDFRRRRAQRRARRAVVQHQQMPFHIFPYPFRSSMSTEYSSHCLPYQYPYVPPNPINAPREHICKMEEAPSTDLSRHLHTLRTLAIKKNKQIAYNAQDHHEVLKPKFIRKRGFDVESLLRDDDKPYKALEFSMPPKQKLFRKCFSQSHKVEDTRMELDVADQHLETERRYLDRDIGIRQLSNIHRQRSHSECGQRQTSACSCHCKLGTRYEQSHELKPHPSESSRVRFWRGYSN